MQIPDKPAEGNSCKSTALLTERSISHRATENKLPKFVTAPNKTPLGLPTGSLKVDVNKPSSAWTRQAMKSPPPWPIDDERWCEVTASGSVSRFYASDRLTPQHDAATLVQKPSVVTNGVVTPTDQKKLDTNTIDQRKKTNTLEFNPWGMTGNWTDQSDPRNKLCTCKVLCPPRGSDTPSGSHYYHCSRHYLDEMNKMRMVQPQTIMTMINDDWTKLNWSGLENQTSNRKIPPTIGRENSSHQEIRASDTVNAAAAESNTIIDTVLDLSLIHI